MVCSMQMKIFTRILLYVFVGCLYFQCEGVPPRRIPPGNIIVEIEGFVYAGDIIRPYDQFGIPSFMERNGCLGCRANYFFIRTESGVHYQGAVWKTDKPADVVTGAPGPAFAYIHLEENIFFEARNFQLYPTPNTTHTLWSYNFPEKNRFYITMIGGPVYFATLQRQTPE